MFNDYYNKNLKLYNDLKKMLIVVFIISIPYVYDMYESISKKTTINLSNNSTMSTFLKYALYLLDIVLLYIFIYIVVKLIKIYYGIYKDYAYIINNRDIFNFNNEDDYYLIKKYSKCQKIILLYSLCAILCSTILDLIVNLKEYKILYTLYLIFDFTSDYGILDIAVLYLQYRKIKILQNTFL